MLCMCASTRSAREGKENSNRRANIKSYTEEDSNWEAVFEASPLDIIAGADSCSPPRIPARRADGKEGAGSPSIARVQRSTSHAVFALYRAVTDRTPLLLFRIAEVCNEAAEAGGRDLHTGTTVLDLQIADEAS